MVEFTFKQYQSVLYSISLILLFSLYAAVEANAACIIMPPVEHTADDTPEYDGVGAFGKLHNTMTLDCLTYVGSIGNEGRTAVLVKDDIGRIHTLRIGSYMGENDGIIVKIEQDAIYVQQTIYHNGEFLKKITIKLSKKKN